MKEVIITRILDREIIVDWEQWLVLVIVASTVVIVVRLILSPSSIRAKLNKIEKCKSKVGNGSCKQFYKTKGKL